MKRILVLAAATLLISSVSACGLTGDLQRPGPLIGSPGDVDPASLPESTGENLPQLPERPNQRNSSDEDDELLGGPGGV